MLKRRQTSIYRHYNETSKLDRILDLLMQTLRSIPDGRLILGNGKVTEEVKSENPSVKVEKLSKATFGAGKICPGLAILNSNVNKRKRGFAKAL